MKKLYFKENSKMSWSWVLMVLFFILSFINVYFALLGLICMLAPLYHTVRGRGKINCSHYCPRGSLFGKFFPYISFNNSLPNWMRSNLFKNLLLIFMFGMMTSGFILSNGSLYKISFTVLRLIIISTGIGIILGIFFKPRAWCQVCPMGHVTSALNRKKEKGE
ncbi:MAG: 4Fe-4S binding protein [Fusobacteriaceae bacterium]|nr:4Fe-4S binding protein [Fusobacteriaceae bacterium]MBN2837428.1 4Fe-4S binding protein [Fusobacteriaceae bacterium]